MQHFSMDSTTYSIRAANHGDDLAGGDNEKPSAPNARCHCRTGLAAATNGWSIVGYDLAGCGARGCVTPTYRVYEDRLFFRCRRVLGELQPRIMPADFLAIRAVDAGG